MKNKSLYELMGIDNKDPIEVLNELIEMARYTIW